MSSWEERNASSDNDSNQKSFQTSTVTLNNVNPNQNEENNNLSKDDPEFELKTKKVDDSFFVGHWVAEGEKAEYMYGNVDIIIREDGTWDGNITEEEIHGKWTREGDGIRLTSDVIPFNMVYSTNNNVILQETDDAVRVVLTKK